VKRFYVPLPEHCGRRDIVQNCLNDLSHTLTNEDIDVISAKTDGNTSLGTEKYFLHKFIIWLSTIIEHELQNIYLNNFLNK